MWRPVSETPAAKSIDIARRAMSYLDLPKAEREPGYQEVYFDSLSPDVELRFAVPEDTYLWGEPRRGKEAVRSFFKDTPWHELLEARGFQSPPEYFANEDGSRVVLVATEGWKVLKTGAEVERCEFAQVMDIQDGLITRIVVIQDQSEWNDAYPRA